ncbi:uncharacterized protein LOC110751221 isoform X2 [Prunus avium]|uniref:Uncharacterized protein LOC110751221 isoform X2 n=1 Tax=Prunus avium TaxID=42229 RepID=A0A6P5RR77_PRUAV|nr:uncharacterized protein LOC110751221 isoform X2 [Prunus avium]
MEDHHSMNSMMRKSVSSDNTRATSHESPEESSWTMYLEDFLTSNNDDGDDDERSSFSSYVYENSSIISDAASAVTRKLSAINGEVLGFDNRSSFGFDRRKTKEALLDDALEDTASSPVNSPKEKGSTSGLVDERNELGFIGRESDCTDLKKRGLCLVPFSVVANYFG